MSYVCKECGNPNIRVVGSTTLHYFCDKCNKPVDPQLSNTYQDRCKNNPIIGESNSVKK